MDEFLTQLSGGISRYAEMGRDDLYGADGARYRRLNPAEASHAEKSAA
ncbi:MULTISPECIES: hypothetical protein [Paenibacillus]|nr:hypothetical protein [Paenibacillus sp. EPM92]